MGEIQKREIIDISGKPASLRYDRRHHYWKGDFRMGRQIFDVTPAYVSDKTIGVIDIGCYFGSAGKYPVRVEIDVIHTTFPYLDAGLVTSEAECDKALTPYYNKTFDSPRPSNVNPGAELILPEVNVKSATLIGRRVVTHDGSTEHRAFPEVDGTGVLSYSFNQDIDPSDHIYLVIRFRAGWTSSLDLWGITTVGIYAEE